MRVSQSRTYQTSASETEAERLDRLAQSFFAIICAESKLLKAGREFLAAADGANRQEIIDHTIQRIATALPGSDEAELRRVIGGAFRKYFGWDDLRRLESAGDGVMTINKHPFGDADVLTQTYRLLNN